MDVSYDWNDSIPFEAGTYKDQPFSQRVQDGLSVDRHGNHFRAYSFNAMFEYKQSKKTGQPKQLIKPSMLYACYRRNFWHTKRAVNAKIVDLAKIHEHMIEIFKPILLDLLLDRQPTAKDWKEMSDKHEKQVRRTEEYYPHLVGRLRGGVKMLLQNQDGTISAYPQKIVRKGRENNRIKEITTAYSSPPAPFSRFDPRVFADDAYARRQRKFWHEAIRILSELLGEGHRVRSSQDWLIRHIVNNDVALHVIFDNIALACELRWFENLSEGAQSEIYWAHAKVYDEDWFGEVGLPLPYAFSLDLAKMAVREHESFVTSFESEIPDNLQRYAIPQPKMKARVYDLIIEAAAALKPYTAESVWAANARQLYLQTGLLHFADDWDLVCMALASSSLSAVRS